ncbi:multi antimicrobial extrusion protein [Trichococcus palustris]|uniref:Probable multidrug resistance protein NorM n=1 Tax=Trichococcus palustris TaxID=140314 RepID=A0A143YVH4_9LACT|nr:MATE family efflux transporter [Trichococcus palustris]CZQ99735.1 multi antimicrobial extrusion protein [Trichococcus palustris]SFK86990.1 putative efflux protein, MATE family [Trichococcus palustris]
MEENKQQPVKKENKMGVMPINKLLVSMSVPMMISMIVQALYNVVDSIFVAQISEKALTAVSLAFPIQNLMIALAVGTGVGINALVSRRLGEKNYPAANHTADNGIFLNAMHYLLFLLFGLFFLPLFFSFQTTDAEIIAYGIDYLNIITLFSVGIFMQVSMERLLQSTGNTMYAMVTQGMGAILNIILNPIFIFGWFGVPAMGIKGSAIATVVGQISAASLAFYFNVRFNKEISLSFGGFRPDLKTIKKIYSIGGPSIVMQAVGSFLNLSMNNILIRFTPTATAVFGVYFKLQSFVFMPVFGLNNGMVPIIAYNYGADAKDRIKETIKLSKVYAMAIMLIGLVIFQLIPEQLLQLFNASDEMLKIGIPALRIFSLCYVFAGYNIVSGSVYQAFGRGGLSLWVSLIRQIVVLLPAAFLLSLLGDVSFVWWAYPIAELFAIVLSLYFNKKIDEEVIKQIYPHTIADVI